MNGTEACLVEENQSTEKLRHLLELTRPASTWQPHLVQLLAQQILESGARHTIAFLQHVLTMGKETLQRTRRANLRSCGCPVPVDKRLAPLVLDIDCWKKILVSLGFEIEQPDGYHSLEHVDVLVGPGVMPLALDGMLHLLTLVNSLPWNILRMILTFLPDEALSLCALSEEIGPRIQDQVTARAFLSRYPVEMTQLGINKQHHVVIKTVGDREQTRLNKTISMTVRAVFQEGPPDIATFV
ncbi:hypothetical protein RRG08_002107 [Elysia crispata]|uniref:Uncharacterized protein n=1 Tax=Elysia crispata TaxID=231223 RepID=A0AAE1DII4_9GAST|nr:hypothetical protein RRG08_002107 [Elysia crispata]